MVRGGKDSQVTYEIVKAALKTLGLPENSIARVFCDTGLEWASVKAKG